jgi:hypothetical protein
MERIFKAAKAHGFEVFISPHYFYPTDKGWKFNGPLETKEATSGMFARQGVLTLDGFEGSGRIGWSALSPTSKMAKPSSSRRTACGGRRPTTSFCNSANGKSARSFWAECSPICASNLTCANCSSKVSRSPSSKMRRPRQGTLIGAMTIRRRSSITRFSHTRSGQRTKP